MDTFRNIFSPFNVTAWVRGGVRFLVSNNSQQVEGGSQAHSLEKEPNPMGNELEGKMKECTTELVEESYEVIDLSDIGEKEAEDTVAGENKWGGEEHEEGMSKENGRTESIEDAQKACGNDVFLGCPRVQGEARLIQHSPQKQHAGGILKEAQLAGQLKDRADLHVSWDANLDGAKEKEQLNAKPQRHSDGHRRGEAPDKGSPLKRSFYRHGTEWNIDLPHLFQEELSEGQDRGKRCRHENSDDPNKGIELLFALPP